MNTFVRFRSVPLCCTAALLGIVFCGSPGLSQDVAPSPCVLDEIVYEGVKSLEKCDLDSLGQWLKAEQDRPAAVRLACCKIVRLYIDRGWAFASVTPVAGTKPGDKRVVFHVTEGPRVFIRDVQFTGNTFVSGPVLRHHINSAPMIPGTPLISKPYVHTMVEANVEKLREYYRSFGFRDITISSEVKWDPDSKAVVLVFHIDEGQRYRVKSTPRAIGKSNAFSKAEITRIIQVKASDFYAESKIKDDVKNLEDYVSIISRKAIVQEHVIFLGPADVTKSKDGQGSSPPAPR